ncbi:hypothetical protein NP493_372g03027 [Ridgeia piscesae]|uniref:Uncharacterized protein n=1 Tax=Ridgeia piscesae TaxID=27915 RepID=A0AAD9L258_RIDPI|nr:hypothetical protein NP493_372g03027 [Ridgeia piscesae]
MCPPSPLPAILLAVSEPVVAPFSLGPLEAPLSEPGTLPRSSMSLNTVWKSLLMLSCVGVLSKSSLLDPLRRFFLWTRRLTRPSWPENTSPSDESSSLRWGRTAFPSSIPASSGPMLSVNLMRLDATVASMSSVS